MQVFYMSNLVAALTRQYVIHLIKVIFILWVGILGNLAQAQLLPNNSNLNVQSVQRWMQSNRDFSPLVQVVDSMHSSEAEVKLFDLLPAAEQDLKINTFLREKKLLAVATEVTVQHGWKSVGEYMRLSTKLGNAIAAYFLADEIANLLPEQKKILLSKADPAVLKAPVTDVNFVKMNEKLLKDYIKAYSKGR